MSPLQRHSLAKKNTKEHIKTLKQLVLQVNIWKNVSWQKLKWRAWDLGTSQFNIFPNGRDKHHKDISKQNFRENLQKYTMRQRKYCD